MRTVVGRITFPDRAVSGFSAANKQEVLLPRRCGILACACRRSIVAANARWRTVIVHLPGERAARKRRLRDLVGRLSESPSL